MAVTNTLKSRHCHINTNEFNYEIQSASSLFNVILYQVVVLILDFTVVTEMQHAVFILIYKIQLLLKQLLICKSYLHICVNVF
jgi:hypothetical protein